MVNGILAAQSYVRFDKMATISEERNKRISKFFDENYEPIQVGKLYSFNEKNNIELLGIRDNASIIFWALGVEKVKRIYMRDVFLITKKEKYSDSGTIRISVLIDNLIFSRIFYPPELLSNIIPYFSLVC